MIHAAFAIAIANSASEAIFKATSRSLALRPGDSVTRRHPYDGVVGRLQSPHAHGATCSSATTRKQSGASVWKPTSGWRHWPSWWWMQIWRYLPS